MRRAGMQTASKADITVAMRTERTAPAPHRRHWGLSAALAALALCGCENEAQIVRQLHERVDLLELDLKQCTQELADRDGQIAVLRRRIDNEPLIKGVEIDDLFVVERIKLASRTGGADFDGQPGDDGVVVYVQPLDASGHVLKAAGQITVQLTDLTTPGQPRELATYLFNDREELDKSWFGGFLTNHYTFRCEFPPQAFSSPTREVHVRVTFLDWLTGRESFASTTVKIDRIDPENTLVPRRTGS